MKAISFAIALLFSAVSVSAQMPHPNIGGSSEPTPAKKGFSESVLRSLNTVDGSGQFWFAESEDEARTSLLALRLLATTKTDEQNLKQALQLSKLLEKQGYEVSRIVHRDLNANQSLTGHGFQDAIVPNRLSFVLRYSTLFNKARAGRAASEVPPQPEFRELVPRTYIEMAVGVECNKRRTKCAATDVSVMSSGIEWSEFSPNR